MSNVTGDYVQSYGLYPAAECCLKRIGLSQDDEKTLAYCVSRYSFSGISDICDYFNWLIFRISNAFAGMIGKSTTWDNTVKVLNDHVLQLVIDEGDLITANPQNELERGLNQRVEATIFKISLYTLESMYDHQCECNAESERIHFKAANFRDFVRNRIQKYAFGQE